MRSIRTQLFQKSLHQPYRKGFQNALQQPQTVVQQQKICREHHLIILYMEPERELQRDTLPQMVHYKTSPCIFKHNEEASSLSSRKVPHFKIPNQK